MTLKQLAIEVLSTYQEPLTSKEIWSKALELGLDKKLKTKSKTPYLSMTYFLYTDKDKKKKSFIIYDSIPKKFQLFNKKLN